MTKFHAMRKAARTARDHYERMMDEALRLSCPKAAMSWSEHAAALTDLCYAPTTESQAEALATLDLRNPGISSLVRAWAQEFRYEA